MQFTPYFFKLFILTNQNTFKLINPEDLMPL